MVVPVPHVLLLGSKMLQKEGEVDKGSYFVINFLIAKHADVAKVLCSGTGFVHALSADALFLHHVVVFLPFWVAVIFIHQNQDA